MIIHILYMHIPILLTGFLSEMKVSSSQNVFAKYLNSSEVFFMDTVCPLQPPEWIPRHLKNLCGSTELTFFEHCPVSACTLCGIAGLIAPFFGSIHFCLSLWWISCRLAPGILVWTKSTKEQMFLHLIFINKCPGSQKLNEFFLFWKAVGIWHDRQQLTSYGSYNLRIRVGGSIFPFHLNWFPQTLFPLTFHQEW